MHIRIFETNCIAIKNVGLPTGKNANFGSTYLTYSSISIICILGYAHVYTYMTQHITCECHQVSIIAANAY